MNVRLIGKAPWLPPVTSSRNGFSGFRGSIVKNSGRTGHPVTIAFAPHAFADTAYPVAILFDNRARILFVNPGSAFGSKMTFGIPRSHVASNIGPAAYPPTPNATAG